MRAILIDPHDQSVRAIVIEERNNDAGIHDIYAALGCECFDTVRITRTDHIFVDDEGLLRDRPQLGFLWSSYPQPLVGRGLVTGHDPEGEPADTSLTVPEVLSHIRWVIIR